MITPQEAFELYPKTGVLVLLHLPSKIRIGLDNMSWIIQNKFKGFKLIPTGAHYLHYSLASEGYKFKEGTFFTAKPGEVNLNIISDPSLRMGI